MNTSFPRPDIDGTVVHFTCCPPPGSLATILASTSRHVPTTSGSSPHKCASTINQLGCTSGNPRAGLATAFQRLHTHEQFIGTGIGGTGTGLATVRQIIGRHGGEV